MSESSPDISRQRLANAARRAATVLHRRAPHLRAFTRGQLMGELFKTGTKPIAATVIDPLLAEGVLVAEGEDRFRLPDHEASIPENWQEAAAEILEVYRAAGLNPPFPGNFRATYPRHIHVDSVLAYLADRGDLVYLDTDLYVTVETADSLKDLLREVAAAAPDGAVTVAAMRDISGSSRRLIVPLLERLDRQGFTKRVGDSRFLA